LWKSGIAFKSALRVNVEKGTDVDEKKKGKRTREKTTN